MSRGDYRAVPVLVVTDEGNSRQFVGRQNSGRLSTGNRQGNRNRKNERLNSELLVAIQQSDENQVKKLLSDGANPEACCRPTMCSTVHLAALRGEVKILEILIEEGASIVSRDGGGRQAVHLASWAGYTRTLELLLDRDPDLVNSPVAPPAGDWREEQNDSWDHNHEEITCLLPNITNGSTPLHIACKLSKVQVVQFLLSNGADVNLKDSQDLTPLDVAGLQGAGKPSPIVMSKVPNHTILAYNDQRNRSSNNTNHYPTIGDLYSHTDYFNSDIFAGSAAPSEIEFEGEKEEFVQKEQPLPSAPSILRDERLGSTDETENSKPLYDIVLALINQGAKVKEDEGETIDGCQLPTCCTTALHTAVAKEDLELIDFLLENGAEQLLTVLNNRGESPLHLAVRKKLIEPLKTMLSWLQLDKIDIKNSHGLTSLQQAVLEEWPSGVGILLEAGADVTIPSEEMQETVLHMAAKIGNTVLLEELLTIKGASEIIDFRDVDGFTPLFRAMEKNIFDNVAILLDYGADLNLTLPNEINVFHYAAGIDSIDILRLLLEEDVVFTHLNRLNDEIVGGLSPLHIAAEKGRVEHVRFFLEKGADVSIHSTPEPHHLCTPLHLAAQRGYSRTVEKILLYDTECLKIKDQDSWTPLHTAACYGHGKCVTIMLQNGANIADTILYHGVKKSALDLIVSNVPKCIDRLENLLDEYIECDDSRSVKSLNCKLTLDFTILLGPTTADKTEDKQLVFLNTLLNNGDPLLKEKLLLHPLVESFLFFKWMKLRQFFIVLLFCYVLHTLTITTFSVLTFVEHIDMSRGWSYTIIPAVMVPIITTEILQAVPLKRYYFLDNESWIKWALIISSLVTLILDPTQHETRHFASLSVLLAWTELLFLFARFPVWGLHVLMFEKVAANIFQVLTRFVFLFVGFLFAFMIHFEGVAPFGNLLEAMCKVLVMVVELDYGSQYEAGGEITVSSVIGRIMYIAFVLLVAMAMSNLIVGMAVSDVAVLENQGRTQRLAKQTAFLSFLELCLYNNVLLSCFPQRFRNFIENFRSVPKWMDVFPNKPTESLPAELRSNLIQKAMQKENQDDMADRSNQSARLDDLEVKLNIATSKLDSILMLIQALNNERN